VTVHVLSAVVLLIFSANLNPARASPAPDRSLVAHS
jgi:hypothetical protein